jgi:hypothetical protein
MYLTGYCPADVQHQCVLRLPRQVMLKTDAAA